MAPESWFQQWTTTEASANTGHSSVKVRIETLKDGKLIVQTYGHSKFDNRACQMNRNNHKTRENATKHHFPQMSEGVGWCAARGKKSTLVLFDPQYSPLIGRFLVCGFSLFFDYVWMKSLCFKKRVKRIVAWFCCQDFKKNLNKPDTGHRTLWLNCSEHLANTLFACRHSDNCATS